MRKNGHDHPRSLIEREALRPGIAIALAAVGYATIAAFVVLHLDARGVGHGATVFGAFATMVVLTRLIGGDLPDRVGPARVAMAAAVVEALGLTTIALSQSLAQAFAGALAMGAAFSLLYPSLSLIVVGRVSATRRGAALGTFTAFFDGGIGLGAPIAGGMAALSSYEGAFLLAAAIALAGAATIALVIAPRSLPVFAGRVRSASPNPAGDSPNPADRPAATGRRDRFCPARRIARTRLCRCRSAAGG